MTDTATRPAVDDLAPGDDVSAGRSAVGTAGVDEAAARLPAHLALWLTPMVLAALAGALAWYVAALDANFQQASALDWGSKLWPQLRQHLAITLWSTVLVLVLAVPLGIVLTRPGWRRLAPPVLTAANSGQAIPAYGLLVLFLAWFGQGQSTAVYALVVFAVLPVLRNTMVGLEQVDRATIEAGRGMGMSRLGVLRRIELPLAVPVMLAGVRTALVINVGMATLAFLIGGGGLGITINSGLKLRQDEVVFVGAAIVALVALAVDWLGAVAERVLRPRGI